MDVGDELATKHSMVTGRAPGCGAAIFFSVLFVVAWTYIIIAPVTFMTDSCWVAWGRKSVAMMVMSVET